MPTFLTTARMDPALAARIEASVSGQKKKHGGAVLAPRLVALVRIAVVLLVVGVVYSVAGVRRREKQELTRTRTELLDAVHARSAMLTDTDKTAVARDEAWLVAFSRAYDGEVIAAELRAPGALAATMARPMVYVRGAIGAFSSSRRIAEAATSSSKDSLVMCLADPPASRAEKDLLPRVRVAYGTGAVLEQKTPHVRRLFEAQAGIPVLLPAWADRVRSASDSAELAKLKRELDRAPLDSAVRAAKAEVLLVAMDEPGDGGGPTELDGERAHWVRVGIVDLTTQKLLVSVRKMVDPAFISAAKKSEFAMGLDSCALAFDIEAALAGKK